MATDIMLPKSPRKGKLVNLRVQLLDDSSHIFLVQAKAMGIVLWEDVVKYLELVEADYFDLEYNDEHGLQCWLDREKPILKQIPNTETVFRFCVKFYTPDPGLLEEEYTRYLFALQVKRDLRTEELPCSNNTLALLASYIVQSEIGDFLEDEYIDSSYLSSCKILPHPSLEVEQKIMEYHKQHIGQGPSEADINLLDTARKIEQYGIRNFPAKDHEGVHLSLAVAHMGIVVFQNFTRINTFSWAKIRKLSFKRKKFLIKLHPENYGYYKDIVEFFFDSRNECKGFWKKCIEHHAFFRCHTVKKLPRNKTRVVSRGSSYRYSGKTQKQLMEYVRENYFKKRPFERSVGGRISRSTSATPKSHQKTTTLNSSDFHVSQNSTASGGSQILADTTQESNHVLPSSRVETAEVHSESSLSGSRSLGSPKLDSARSHSQPAITLEQDGNRNDHQAPGSSPHNTDNKVESSDHVHGKIAKSDLNGISVSLSSDRQQTLSANQNANDNAGNHNLSSILSTSSNSGKEKGPKKSCDSSDTSTHILKSVHFMSDVIDKNGNADSTDDIPLQTIPRSNRFDNISDIGEDYDYDYQSDDDDSDDQSDDDDDHSDDEGSVDKLEYNVSLEEIASHEDINRRDSPLTIEKLSAERDQLRGHRRMGSKERVLTWNIAEMSLEGTSGENDWERLDSGEIIDMIENDGPSDWDGGELYLNLDTKDSKGIEDESDELSSSPAVQDVMFSLGVPTDESSELITETDTSPTADEMVEEGGEDSVPFENIPPLPPSSSFSESSKVIDDLLPKSDSGISGIEDSRISCSLETEEEDRLHEILRQVDSGEELDKSPAERETLNFPSSNRDFNSENNRKDDKMPRHAKKSKEKPDSNRQNLDNDTSNKLLSSSQPFEDNKSTSHNVLNNISNLTNENKLNKYNKPNSFVNGSDLIKDIPYILHRRLKIDKELKDETELFALTETECHNVQTVESKLSSSLLLEQLNLNNECQSQRKSRGPSPNRRSPSCRTPKDHSPASPRRFELVSYNKLPPKTSYSSIDDTTSPSLEKEILEQIQKRAQKENNEKNKKSEITAGKEDNELVDTVVGNTEFVTYRKLPAKDSFSSLDHTTSPTVESDIEKHRLTVGQMSVESEHLNDNDAEIKSSELPEQSVDTSVHLVKGLRGLPEPASVASIKRTIVEDENSEVKSTEVSTPSQQEIDLYLLSSSTADDDDDDDEQIIDTTTTTTTTALLHQEPRFGGLLLDLNDDCNSNEAASNNDNDRNHFNNDPASVAALILSQDIDTEPNERKITFSTFKPPPPSPGSLIGDESEGSSKINSANPKSSNSLVKQDSVVSLGKPLTTITEEESTTDSSRAQSDEMTQKLSGSLRRRNLSCEFALPRRHSATDDADDSSLADSQLEDESFDVHDLLEPLEHLQTDDDSEEDFNGSSTSFTRDSETSEACSNSFLASNRRALSHPASNSSSESSSSGESDYENRKKLLNIDPLAELENLDMTKLESSDDDEITENKTSDYMCTLAPAASTAATVSEYRMTASSHHDDDDDPKNATAPKLDAARCVKAGSHSKSTFEIERTRVVELNLEISAENPCGRSISMESTYKRVVFCESSSDNTDFQETDSSAAVSSPDGAQLSPLTPDNAVGGNSEKEQRTSAVYQNPYAETVLRQELNFSPSQ